MGQPVVHFEVIGKDGDKLKSYYSELLGWEFDSDNPMDYGVVARDGNVDRRDGASPRKRAAVPGNRLVCGGF